jgi:leucyl-tRNA synthetase
MENKKEEGKDFFSIKINTLIKEISQCIEKFHINVAIAKLYIFLNTINDVIEKKEVEKEIIVEIYKKYLIIISAFVPYISNECWEKITKKNDLTSQQWPEFKDNHKKRDNFDIVVQINGKKRAIINANFEENEENIFSKCLAIKNIKVILDNKKIVKKIFIKNKLLNIVTND